MPKKATPPASAAKLHLPRIARVELKHFSLFSARPTIAVSLKPGVFCLAGANGLGKSTFLTCVNYALTGLVPEPDRKFESVDEYYKFCLPFAASYFAGRIDERQREEAYVGVEMFIRDRRYRLKRRFFEAEALLDLVIEEQHAGTWRPLSDYADMPPARRHEQYVAQLTQDVGVAGFEQFAFLQHFVLTFDERRHLLFWDTRVLDQALFIAFGVDYAEAQRADSLQRDWEKADSLARNAMWQATQLRNRISELRSAKADLESKNDEDDDIVARYEALRTAADEARKRADRIWDERRDAELKLTELTARQASLRNDYADEYSRRIGKLSYLHAHPIVAGSLQENRCHLCGTQRDDLDDVFREWLRAKQCPLCGTGVESDPPKTKNMKRLRELDEELLALRTELESAARACQRLSREHETADSRATTTHNALAEFEAEYHDRLPAAGPKNGDGELATVIAQLEAQATDALNRKTSHRRRRDEKGKELKALRTKIQRQYGDAEEDFVPTFTDLAHAFLGLDLAIALESKSAGLQMVLQVKGTHRRHTHQLSESQRFFVDIALRMALAQYMSNGSAACLMIDTPEGSLDIAYESRAGEMMARFVDKGFSVLMTANINSSQLLRRLAMRCGSARMTLQRMTTWTELSEVQMEEEGLFSSAYEEIEAALASGPPSDASSVKPRRRRKR